MGGDYEQVRIERRFYIKVPYVWEKEQHRLNGAVT